MSKILSALFKGFVEFYSLSFAIITFSVMISFVVLSSLTLIESFLLSSLLINIGLRGIVAFVGNWFPVFSKDIALKYGWEERNTYQKEIAAADGAIGCAGLLSFWIRGDFWTAVILIASICWLLSETANISSIFRGKRNSEQKLKSDYDVSLPIFIGMHIDVIFVGLLLAALMYWKLKF